MNRAERAVRRGEALQLRLGGASFRQIADKLDFGGPSGAFKAVDQALKDYLQEPADQLRQLELARLDAWTLSLAPACNAGDTDAIRTALRVMERRTKLTGLDAPIWVDIRAQLVEQAKEFGFTEDEAVQAAEEILAKAARSR